MSAKQITDKSEWRESLTRTNSGGWEGLRHFRVNSADATEAMLDPELPAVGDAWDGRLPGLIVVKIGPSEKVGGYHTGPDVGWTRVPVEYKTQDAMTTKRATPDRRAWTEISFQPDSDTIYKPFARLEGTPGPPINNGNGVDVPSGSILAKVTANYTRIQEVPPLNRLKNLARPGRINAAAITLPRVYGTALSYTIDPGQALYRGFDGPAFVDGYLRLVHTLELAETWDYRWAVQDSAGNLNGATFLDRIFETGDFAGLWPP